MCRMSTVERPLRRDAERNRQRILEAARIVFAERGLAATMDEIADEAGVGVGTVYRRFPEKELLIDALFDDQLSEMVALADAAVADPDPWHGLVTFLQSTLERQCADRGLKELLLGSPRGHVHVERAREQIVPRMGQVIARAQAAGMLRPDVSVPDFALLQMTLGALVDYTRDVQPEAWRRMLALILDGLRAEPGPPSELPIEPLSMDELELTMRNWKPAGR
jgi:AcrR family transcriptional regulator